jgi:hypothetical protein
MDKDSSRDLARRSMLFALGIATSLAALASPTSINVGDASATTQSTAGSIAFPLTRSGDLSYPVDVQYHTHDGTAISGSDYTGGSGALHLAAGQGSATLSIPITASSGMTTADKQFQLVIDGAIGSGSPMQFSAPASASSAGLDPIAVTTADINGDGRPDVVSLDNIGTDVQVYLNTTAPGATTASFAAMQPVSLEQTGNPEPYSVVATDVNGDGHPDLVVSTQVGNVTVLVNTTPPGATTVSFAPAQIFATSNNSQTINVVDFNGDGRPDIEVAVTGLGSIEVLLNTTAPGASSASFSAAKSFAISGYGRSAAVADFNGDGLPDLAGVANSTVTMLRNTTQPGASDASVAAAQNFNSGGDSPLQVRAADVNGDSRPDLFVVDEDGGVSVLLNTTAAGAKSFSFAPAVVFAKDVLAGSIAIGDIDGDGRPDLVLPNNANGTGTIAVLRNTTAPGASAPSFADATLFALGNVYPLFAALADFDGDGRLDVVSSNGDGTVSALLNRTPAPPPAASFSPLQSTALAAPPYLLLKGDFDGDGRPDVAIAQDDGSIAILLDTTAAGAATPSFAAPQLFQPPSSASGLMIGDFNGDGRSDLASVNNSSNTVSVYFNTTAAGSKTLAFTQVVIPITGLSSGCCSSFVIDGAVADFNGDGALDIEVSTTGGFSAVLLNQVAPGAATADFVETHVAISAFKPIVVADIDGDGRPDLIGDDGGAIAVYLNTTVPGMLTSSFTDGGSFSYGTKVSADTISIGDVNGDGRPDLVVGGNGMALLLNNTTPGATTAAFTLAASPTVPKYARSPLLGDFDGDGKLDIALTAELGGGITVLMNTTPAVNDGKTATFTTLTTLAPGVTVLNGAIADFNGDGKPDIAAGDYDSNNLIVMLDTQMLASVTASSGSTATGTIHSLAIDTAPDAFAFIAANNATLAQAYTSNAITVAGIDAAAAISISVGSYSIGCTGSFVTAAATISNGQTVCVRQTSSSAFSTATTATLTIGGVTASYVVTTLAADTTPDAFSFAAANGVQPNAVANSAAIAVAGINTAAPISISGGSYSINGGALTSAAGTVNNGDNVQVRVTASAAFATSVSATLSIGGVNGSYVVTTRAATTAPMMFNFTSVTGAALDTLTTSDAISVTGIEAPASITISGDSGAAFCINANPCVNMVGATVAAGDSVRVQVRSSAAFSTMTKATLNIGGVAADFDVTTLARDTAPDGFSFAPVVDVEPGSMQTSNAITVAGINDGAPISVVGGSYRINGAAATSTPATVQAGDQVSVQLTASSSYGAQTTATLSIGGVSAAFKATTRVADVKADAFSFAPVAGVARSTVISSNGIIVSGVEQNVAIAVEGGEYSINGGAYTSDAGSVANGASVVVRVLSSAGFSSSTAVTLTLGSGSDAVAGSFSVSTLAAVTTPDAFGFGVRSGVALQSVQESNDIVIDGINTAAPISVSGGEYSLDDGRNYTSAPGVIAPGGAVRVRVTASAAFSTSVTATLTVGDISGTFVVTTLAADTTPDAFAFVSVSNAPLASLQTSNEVTIIGLNTASPIHVDNGRYSIDGGAFTADDGVIASGAQVRVQQTASASFGTLTSSTLTIGGVSGAYQVTTLAADTDPQAFAFGSIDGAALSSLQTSTPVTIAGINTSALIHIGNGEYRINEGDFTSIDGLVNDRDQVTVRTTASAEFSTTVVATITIGDVGAAFTVRTLAQDATPDSFAFNSVSGVNPLSVQTSEAVTITGINAAVNVHVDGGSYSIDGGPFVSTDGSVVSGQQLRLRMQASADYSTTTQATLTIGDVSASFAVTTLENVIVHAKGGGAVGPWLLLVLGLAAIGRRGGTRFKKTLRAHALLLAPLLLISSPVDALELSDFYAGTRIGQAQTDASDQRISAELARQGFTLDIHTDNKRFAGEVYAGYRINHQLALEAGFLRGSQPTMTATGAAPPDPQPLLKAAAHAMQGFGNAARVGIALTSEPAPGLRVNGRVSLVYWDGHASVDAGDVSVSDRDSGLGFALGTGINYQLWRGLSIGPAIDYYYLSSTHSFTFFSGQLQWDFGG